MSRQCRPSGARWHTERIRVALPRVREIPLVASELVRWVSLRYRAALGNSAAILALKGTQFAAKSPPRELVIDVDAPHADIHRDSTKGLLCDRMELKLFPQLR